MTGFMSSKFQASLPPSFALRSFVCNCCCYFTFDSISSPLTPSLKPLMRVSMSKWALRILLSSPFTVYTVFIPPAFVFQAWVKFPFLSVLSCVIAYSSDELMSLTRTTPAGAVLMRCIILIIPELELWFVPGSLSSTGTGAEVSSPNA